MAELAESAATYEDLLNAPENMVAEILCGRLVTHPRPAPRHALAASSLEVEIGGAYHRSGGDGPGGWWVLMEPEIHLGAHVVVPDLAGWRRERMPKLPETAWFDLRPDWVCEVMSPSTARFDRVEKRAIYAAAEIPHLWMVDPDARTLEAFELRNGDWTLLGACANDDAVSFAPFAEAAFSLAALWQD